MNRLAVASYAVRCGLSIGLASLLPLLCAAEPAASRVFAVPLFAPVFACVIVGPTHRGVTIKSAALLMKGWCAGAVVTSLALAAMGPHKSEAKTYISLVLLSLLVLYPSAYAPLTQKMAMDCVIVALFVVQSSGIAGSGWLFPFQQLASVTVGTLAALAVSLLPWPRCSARGEAGEQLRAAEEAAGALVRLLARAFGDGAASPGSARLLAARAAALRASAGASLAQAQALADAAAWEEWLLPATRLRDCAGPQRDRRAAALTDLLLAADGMRMALAGIRAAEAQHAHAVTRARLAALHHASSGSSAGLSCDAPAADDFDRLDSLLGAQVAALGAAAAAAMLHIGDDDAQARLRHAVSALDAALLRARAEVYYARAPPSLAHATLTSYGPPVEHYMYLLSLGRFAARLAQEHAAVAAAAADALAPPPGEARSVLRFAGGVLRSTALDLFGPYAERPKRVRVLYAIKLVSSVVLASFFGVLSYGSGLWAAITAQIVGARSSVYVGGSFQTASARLSGTLIGAMFGYFTMSVAHKAPLGVSMAMLAGWCAVCSCMRTSPRNAYAALVAQFVPFIIVLGSHVAPGNADAAVQSTKAYAYARIEQNFIGILCFVAVELLVLPQRASTLLQAAMANTLRAAAESASAAWAPMLPPQRCAACAASHAAAAQATLTGCMRRHAMLLAEASDEPAWLAPRRAGALVLLRTLSQERLAKLDTLLALMHVAAAMVVAPAQHASLAPMAAPIAALHDGLRELFASLAEDLDAGANAHRTHACAAAVDAALQAFEAAYGVQLVALREAHLATAAPWEPQEAWVPPPPIELVMPLDALIFCTRELVTNVDGIAAAVREYLQDDAELLQRDVVCAEAAVEAPERGAAAELELLERRSSTAALLKEDAAPDARTAQASEARVVCECGAPL
jgi:hypothetical protein